MMQKKELPVPKQNKLTERAIKAQWTCPNGDKFQFISRHLTKLFQTLTVFHPPLENNHKVNKPTEVSEINTPQNTPECCQPSLIAKK